MHSRLESLRSSVEGKLEASTQKEFQELKDQVTQLGKRWSDFKRRLTTAIGDNKRAIERQKEFDKEHVKIRSVLENVLGATDNTSFDETDTAVDLERVEVSVTKTEKRVYQLFYKGPVITVKYMFPLSLISGNLLVNFSCKTQAPLVTFAISNTENQHLLFSSFHCSSEHQMHPYVICY